MWSVIGLKFYIGILSIATQIIRKWDVNKIHRNFYDSIIDIRWQNLAFKMLRTHTHAHNTILPCVRREYDDAAICEHSTN